MTPAITVTQLYFEGDSLIPFDPASNMSELWIALDTLTNGGFKGSFALGVSQLVGIEEHEFADVRILPNPSDGILHLSSRLPRTVVLRNNQGQNLYSERIDSGQTTLDCSTLPKGFYILVMSDEYHRIVLQ